MCWKCCVLRCRVKSLISPEICSLLCNSKIKFFPYYIWVHFICCFKYVSPFIRTLTRLRRNPDFVWITWSYRSTPTSMFATDLRSAYIKPFFISMSVQFTWNLMMWCCRWRFSLAIGIYTTLKHYLLPLVYIYVMSRWKIFLRYDCCSFSLDTHLMVATVICL
jgi:hypothetical protein